MTRQKINNEIDWEFCDYAARLETEWRQSQRRFSDKELLQVFPEAKDIIPEKIVEWEKQRESIAGLIRKKLQVVKEKSSQENQWFWREIVKAWDGTELLEVDQHIARLRRLLSVARGRVPKGRLTEEQIEQARSAPIENLINQPLRKSGKSLVGLCPLHNERHSSFHIYPETNSCWCYGCGQGGDSINFIKLLRGYSFREAVQYLITK